MNSKQRKLKYIRQKNNLRNGGVLIDFYKSNFSATTEQQAGILESIVNHQEKRLKMQLKVKDIICNYQNDDFMSDIVTTKIFLTRKQ